MSTALNHPLGGNTSSYRIRSIDIVRGIVMIIMALDHTRDFFHETAMTANPLDPANPALFFTRWITHFCAPTFVFLSGVSAYLSSLKKSKNEASLFLIKRGFWLILVEMILITFAITFNPHYNTIIWQVIWAIGCSMVLLGIVSRISRTAVLVTGIVLFFGHNILDLLKLPTSGRTADLLGVFLTTPGTLIGIDSNHFIGVFYAILPWTGVMMMGYSVGHWFTKDFGAERRKKLLLLSGFSLIILFIILRATNLYGDPTQYKPGNGFMYNLLTFINTTKYPPSLQYVSMTLGPACILLALLENAEGRWTKIVSVYGTVPFFYYVIHFYLIHTLLVIVFFITGHTTHEIIDPNLPFYFRPLNFGFHLWVVYLIWLSIVILLYFPCRWFSQYKRTHRQWWLSYI